MVIPRFFCLLFQIQTLPKKVKSNHSKQNIDITDLGNLILIKFRRNGLQSVQVNKIKLRNNFPFHILKHRPRFSNIRTNFTLINFVVNVK